MGRMSELHHQQAPERAERLENEVHHLEMVVRELSDALRPFAGVEIAPLESECDCDGCLRDQFSDTVLARPGLSLDDFRRAAEVLALHGAKPAEVIVGPTTAEPIHEQLAGRGQRTLPVTAEADCPECGF